MVLSDQTLLRQRNKKVASGPALSQRSILFEIVNREAAGDPVESFALIIPPDSISFTFPQRIVRTKTFAGMFEDDYGMDNGRITIAGNTGNSDVKDMILPSGRARQMDGKQAAYFLRDHLARYKEQYTPDYNKMELRVYDLSSVDAGSIVSNGSVNGFIDGYVVSLTDFQVQRNKDRPLFYTYSIDLLILEILGVNREAVKKPTQAKKGTEILALAGAATNGVASLRTFFSQVNDVAGKARAILEKADELRDNITEFNTKVTEVINRANGILADAAGVIPSTLGAAWRLGQTLVYYPAGLAKQMLRTAREYLVLIRDTPDALKFEGENISEAYTEAYSMALAVSQVAAELCVPGKAPQADAKLTVMMNASQGLTASLMDRSSSIASPGAASIPDNMLGSPFSPEQIDIYGFSVITATNGQTLEIIAGKYLGNPALASLVGLLNGIVVDAELTAGASVLIPILTPRTSQPSRNQIYSDTPTAFGVDIAIGESGQAVLGENGDYATISGTDNLLQALNLRLASQLGERIRLTAYGIAGGIGSAMGKSAAVSYMITNIVDTLMQEPRVKSVDAVLLEAKDSAVYIMLTITPISGTSITLRRPF
jgi:hypothetical protein